MVAEETIRLLEHLASRPGHDEVKAGFRELLTSEFGAGRDEVDFERRVPEVRGRIDALVGRTVFEAKRNLRREWRDVERRLPEYLADREREEGERFVGLASDGLEWVALELDGRTLTEVGRIVLDPTRPERFLAWLDGVLALRTGLSPDPETVRVELGGDSLVFRRVRQRLLDLWARSGRDPAIALKRQLWARLLRLVYGQDVDSDELWVQHTYLVVLAKAIATAVLGMREDDPRRLLSGAAFADRGVHGAVEADFFDWVGESDAGRELVRKLLAQVRRFRFSDVESDVLKVLYESLIDRSERHRLGEYYTPDWLAAKIVRKAVTHPTVERVLDPSCGSGTFVFHAVRCFLREAEEAGMPRESLAAEATAHVAGMDIHPVAVLIARITYILALGPALAAREGAISIPIYLGDALQLSIEGGDMIQSRELVIEVPPPPAGEGRSGERDARGREILSFPDTFCRDMALFDILVEEMRGASESGRTPEQFEAAARRAIERHYRRDVTEEERRALGDLRRTYELFDRLRREGRDTVWAYVARNLSRPLALSAGGGRAHVLVGNPPWLAFRHMSQDLQRRFRALAQDEGIYVGGNLATQNDLAALFVVRATSLYLRPGGRLAFVMPLATLSRGQYEPFRRGSYNSCKVAFDAAWTMDSCLEPLFPVPSCVVFGRKRNTPAEIPETVRAYCGHLPRRDASEEEADRVLTVTEGAPRPVGAETEGGSVYRALFLDGATLYPRVLCLVERAETRDRLGVNPARPHVRSRRSTQEKEPWRSLPPLEASVEAEFLRPVLLGESLVPFRVFRAFEAVIPVDPANNHILDAQAAADRGYSGLHGWMSAAEAAWEAHKSASTTFSLVGRWNYHRGLANQLPVPPLRVAYTKSGMNLVAAVIRDRRAVIDHTIYWFAPESEEEALYLAALLNAEELRRRIEHLQARGQFGRRHFDKVIFTLPIPRFDADDALHGELAALAREAEAVADGVSLSEDLGFQKARKAVREALEDAGIAQRLDALVTSLLEPH